MLVLYHDYTSAASAVAVARLQRLMHDGVTAVIRGTEVFGIDATLPVTLDMLAELDAVAADAAVEGVVLHRPPAVPPTTLAHVVERVAVAHDLDMEWRERCYRAYWSEGVDISDADALRRLADDVGMPGDAVDRALGDRVTLLEVRQRSVADRGDGIGGVPTIAYERTLVPGLLPESDLRALATLSDMGDAS